METPVVIGILALAGAATLGGGSSAKKGSDKRAQNRRVAQSPSKPVATTTPAQADAARAAARAAARESERAAQALAASRNDMIRTWADSYNALVTIADILEAAQASFVPIASEFVYSAPGENALSRAGALPNSEIAGFLIMITRQAKDALSVLNRQEGLIPISTPAVLARGIVMGRVEASPARSPAPSEVRLTTQAALVSEAELSSTQASIEEQNLLDRLEEIAPLSSTENSLMRDLVGFDSRSLFGGNIT